jgi:hypothetical protein
VPLDDRRQSVTFAHLPVDERRDRGEQLVDQLVHVEVIQPAGNEPVEGLLLSIARPFTSAGTHVAVIRRTDAPTVVPDVAISLAVIATIDPLIPEGNPASD